MGVRVGWLQCDPFRGIKGNMQTTSLLEGKYRFLICSKTVCAFVHYISSVGVSSFSAGAPDSTISTGQQGPRQASKIIDPRRRKQEM